MSSRSRWATRCPTPGRATRKPASRRKLDKLRAVAGTYNNYIQIVASADSGIKTLADLKGKRISVGAAESGTELNARAILKAAGLTYKDLAKVEYLPFGESVELMKNRQLDATLQSAGLGVASIRDLATSIKIVVVSVPADVVAKIGDPAYQPAVIPANTYTGQDSRRAVGGDPQLPGHARGVSGDTGLPDDQDRCTTTSTPCTPRTTRPRPSSARTPSRACRCPCTRVPSATTTKSGVLK